MNRTKTLLVIITIFALFFGILVSEAGASTTGYNPPAHQHNGKKCKKNHQTTTTENHYETTSTVRITTTTAKVTTTVPQTTTTTPVTTTSVRVTRDTLVTTREDTPVDIGTPVVVTRSAPPAVAKPMKTRLAG